MMNPLKLNTASVSVAVTPTVVSTLLSHYLNRGPLRHRPTAHLSYDEGLHLIRSFLQFASHHTVEELQAFTAQWVPHPQWVRVKEVAIPGEQLERAATLLQAELGDDGIRQVGGTEWWQWRKPDSPLKAEWIEMRSDYQERKRSSEKGKRVMLYVHGGAYFFGSVDEHRYQMQRHARKLQARVFAPKYRLAPQFPFPCGLQDCIAAYLYLLTVQEPNEIILAGDSAGGGMVVSMLCTLRDQGIPLPAGAVLISPWVDLTHSFPSVSADNPFDYIPSSGFHHKPSRSWPPPNEDDMAMMWEQAKSRKSGNTDAVKTSTLESKQAQPFKLESANGVATSNGNLQDEESPREAPAQTEDARVQPTSVLLSVMIDGKHTEVKDQIQMYTTNELLPHPLVSPVTQPTLGGLPPLLIMVGGGEVLRDEQIYLAHKCANPSRYAPPDDKLDSAAREKLSKYKPTDVQLQVWDDLCHVAPTLSFTRPAKYQYRSIAQFGAWALARAQHTEIDILDDDNISFISVSGSDDDSQSNEAVQHDKEVEPPSHGSSPFQTEIGKAGDTLPPFKGHMIRQRVTRHGAIYNLPPPSELPGCMIDKKDVGVAKEIPVRRWLETKAQWERRYASARAKVHRQIINDMVAGFIGSGDGERPPPTALAGRRKAPPEKESKKKSKSMGLALWSLWGSKHDEATVQRERQAEKEQETATAEAASLSRSASRNTPGEAEGPTTSPEIESQAPVEPLESSMSPAPAATDKRSRSRSRRRTVVDEHQTSQQADEAVGEEEDAPVMALIALRRDAERKLEAEANAGEDAQTSAIEDGDSETSKTNNGGFLSPDYVPETGVAGKRPHLGGIALPFSLGKEADTASMMTLHSAAGVVDVRPTSPASAAVKPSHAEDADEDGTTGKLVGSFLGPQNALATGVTGKRPQLDGVAVPFSLGKEADTASMRTLHSAAGGSDIRPISPFIGGRPPPEDGAGSQLPSRAISPLPVRDEDVGLGEAPDYVAPATMALGPTRPGSVPRSTLDEEPSASEKSRPSIAGRAEEDAILSGEAAKEAARLVG